MNYWKAARERVGGSDVLRPHWGLIFYDWHNQDEHFEWVALAGEEEILDWLEAISGDADEAGCDT